MPSHVQRQVFVHPSSSMHRSQSMHAVSSSLHNSFTLSASHFPLFRPLFETILRRTDLTLLWAIHFQFIQALPFSQQIKRAEPHNSF